MSDLFTLRPAREADVPLLHQYCYAEGMDTPDDLEHVTVAVNADDVVVGLIRLLPAPVAYAGENPLPADAARDDLGFINPVVTYSAWRGYGVGQALTDFAKRSFAELRCVSRGGSLSFYEMSGFVRCSLDDMPQVIKGECVGCPMSEECGPVPMRWSR